MSEQRQVQHLAVRVLARHGQGDEGLRGPGHNGGTRTGVASEVNRIEDVWFKRRTCAVTCVLCCTVIWLECVSSIVTRCWWLYGGVTYREGDGEEVAAHDREVEAEQQVHPLLVEELTMTRGAGSGERYVRNTNINIMHER